MCVYVCGIHIWMTNLVCLEYLLSWLIHNDVIVQMKKVVDLNSPCVRSLVAHFNLGCKYNGHNQTKEANGAGKNFHNQYSDK